MKVKTTLALILGTACALGATSCRMDEEKYIELKMEVNAPACSNHPRVQVHPNNRGYFSEECGNYDFSHHADGSSNLYELGQQGVVAPRCYNTRIWNDENGDGFVEKVELVSSAPCDERLCPYLEQEVWPNYCGRETTGYLFHTPELQQEYEAILRGIGKNEVEANVDTWLHGNQ